MGRLENGTVSRTPEEEILVGNACEHLRKEMLAMYWTGVKGELTNIIETLREWQSWESFSDPLPDEKLDDDHLVQGYECFLKNICHDPRLATSHNPIRCANRVRMRLATRSTSTKHIGLWQKRALMLLQSAQFLDIDYVFEYREPGITWHDIKLPIWDKLSPPLLNLEITNGYPVFHHQRCSECHLPIRSSSYHPVANDATILCETCFRSRPDYNLDNYRKHYKTCCLPSQLSDVNAGLICRCESPHNRYGKGDGCRWPLGVDEKGDCGLFEINRLIAESKQSGTSETYESKSMKETRPSAETSINHRIIQAFRALRRTKTLPNLNLEADNPGDISTSHGKSYSVEEAPIYLHSRKDNYPFGNVHVAIRFGPLTIENGVESNHGVTITRRSCSKLQKPDSFHTNDETCLLLKERNNRTEKYLPRALWNRTLYTKKRAPDIKRYKAMAKQVVGGAFSGFFDAGAEHSIADKLLQDATNGATIQEVFEKVQAYLLHRVQRYIDSIVDRLLDPRVALFINEKTNSCQTFCNNIIDKDTFGPLFDRVERRPFMPALYLMSFVCRSDTYISKGPGPLYDTPYGNIEEYLLRHRFGKHDESDVIDTLQEYWYDWGNFEWPPYRYQDIFPWDCTEGYNESTERCSSCNIARHAWAFPFDSFSLISLHLSRGRHLYPQSLTPKKDTDIPGPLSRKGGMSDSNWFENRLNVLIGQYSLLIGSVAMARSDLVRKCSSWIWNESEDRYIDRIKLGGIVRAQPFSHHFEGGKYYQYYVADWTSLGRKDRIAQYEKIRDARARKSGGLKGFLRSLKPNARSKPGPDPTTLAALWGEDEGGDGVTVVECVGVSDSAPEGNFDLSDTNADVHLAVTEQPSSTIAMISTGDGGGIEYTEGGCCGECVSECWWDCCLAGDSVHDTFYAECCSCILNYCCTAGEGGHVDGDGG